MSVIRIIQNTVTSLGTWILTNLISHASTITLSILISHRLNHYSCCSNQVLPIVFTIMSKKHNVRVEGKEIIQYETPHGKHQLLPHAHTSIRTQSNQRIKYTKILFYDILTHCQGFDMFNPNLTTVGMQTQCTHSFHKANTPPTQFYMYNVYRLHVRAWFISSVMCDENAVL